MGSGFSITNLNGNHYHEIIPNLYVGDQFSIYEKFFEQQRKIVIINATPNVKFNRKIKSVNYRIPVEDDLRHKSNMELYFVLSELVGTINRYLDKNYVILVHCVAGRQRSCAIIAAYLMKYKNMTLDKAIYEIKRKRPHAFFGGVNFKTALIKFNKNLY